MFTDIRSNFSFLFHLTMKFMSAIRIGPDWTPRHIWGFSVCQCPIKRTPGLHGLSVVGLCFQHRKKCRPSRNYTCSMISYEAFVFQHIYMYRVQSISCQYMHPYTRKPMSFPKQICAQVHVSDCFHTSYYLNVM